MRYRPHRMGMDLFESAELGVTLENRAALVRMLAERWDRFRVEVTDDMVEVKLYSATPEHRLTPPWLQTYLVYIPMYGTQGYLDEGGCDAVTPLGG